MRAVCLVAVAVISLEALLFGRPVVAETAHFNILMIGNSYTQGNATARATSADLQGLFDADPDFSADITVRADSSASLQNHAGNVVTTQMITNPANTWDLIILQERSTRPALAMKYGGSELNGLDNGGPVLISNFIKPLQSHASVVLFSTWARELGNEDLVADFNNNPTEMLSYTDLGNDRIRKKFPSWDFSSITSIARVGDAWDEWYRTYGYASPNGLHDLDGVHQNQRGAYLAASVLFETITNKTSIGNSYVGAVTGTIGGVNTVRLLQLQASAITGDYSESADFDADGYIDGRDLLAWQRGFGLSGGAETTDGDANGDGFVDAEDLAIWQAQFGSPISPSMVATTAVPEPSASTSLVVAMLMQGNGWLMGMAHLRTRA